MWRLERLFAPSLLQESSIALALNRKLYENSLADISAADLTRRPSEATNHLLWIAGHLASTRASLASMMGAPIEDEMSIFSKAIEPGATYPSIDEVRSFFVKATGKIQEALPSISAEKLRGPAPFALPINDATLLGAIAFFVQHEAYHVGQMGLLRKYLGQEATSYA
jgi:uncharacterized damage-inducible protein DinB